MGCVVCIACARVCVSRGARGASAFPLLTLVLYEADRVPAVPTCTAALYVCCCSCTSATKGLFTNPAAVCQRPGSVRGADVRIGARFGALRGCRRRVLHTRTCMRWCQASRQACAVSGLATHTHARSSFRDARARGSRAGFWCGRVCHCTHAGGGAAAHLVCRAPSGNCRRQFVAC